MELKNFNNCTIFLCDYIDAKISYFDCPEFINMYTDKQGDNSEGKLYLAYSFDTLNWLPERIKQFSNNKHYYNWYPYKTKDGLNCILFEFKVDKKQIDKLESDKKCRFISSYNDIKNLLPVWKDHLKEFDSLLINNIFDINCTCTC